MSSGFLSKFMISSLMKFHSCRIPFLSFPKATKDFTSHEPHKFFRYDFWLSSNPEIPFQISFISSSGAKSFSRLRSML